jgi:hypothetical protein
MTEGLDIIMGPAEASTENAVAATAPNRAAITLDLSF